MRIAFLAPAPDFPEAWDWAFGPQSRPLIGRGATVDAIRWTNAADLTAYDLILPLISWGYHLRYGEWLAFLDRLEAERLPVVNPPQLLRWNSDKAYLAELQQRGVATVPSVVVERCDDTDIAEARERFSTDQIVVKPLVSAAASGTFRLGHADGLPNELRERRLIIQPMVDSVLTTGEYSLILFDGVLSHTVVKRPKSGDFRVQPHLGGSAHRCEPPPGSEALATAALASAPARATYARIDMVEDTAGELMVMEMEMIEPALFLAEAQHGAEAFADAVFSAAKRLRK